MDLQLYDQKAGPFEIPLSARALHLCETILTAQ